MFEDLIKKRRSVRKYSDKKIDKKDLERILKAGLHSPTAKNRDCLHFIVVEEKNTLFELSKFKNHAASFIKDCQAAVAVLTDKDVADITYSQDACIAATFLMFAATDLGIGSCFVNARSIEDGTGFNASKNIREILNIPEKYNVECVISLGYPANEVREKQPFDFETHVSYERF